MVEGQTLRNEKKKHKQHSKQKPLPKWRRSVRQEDLSELIEQGTTSESDFSGLCNSQLHSAIMRALLARVRRCPSECHANRLH